MLACLWTALAASAALNPTDRFTLQELEQAPKLTPHQFANLFQYFEFSGSPYVLPPEEFLDDRAGDCDDYAILADYILGRQGYHTRLIQIVLTDSDTSHAVCYVTENKAYLDYNNRKYVINLERSGTTLRQIAAKVAASFEKDWTSVFEFTYKYEIGHKRLRYIVVKTDPPDRDPDRPAAAGKS